jgi:hypothetical protein
MVPVYASTTAHSTVDVLAGGKVAELDELQLGAAGPA